MKNFRRRLWAKIIQPLAFLHLRYCQHKFRWISRPKNKRRGSTDNYARLCLLQSYIDYYKTQFTAWGKYHPKFTFSQKGAEKHKARLKWLFPPIDYDTGVLNLVYERSAEAAVKRKNKIFRLEQELKELRKRK